jgi:hypothetical protein
MNSDIFLSDNVGDKGCGKNKWAGLLCQNEKSVAEWVLRVRRFFDLC